MARNEIPKPDNAPPRPPASTAQPPIPAVSNSSIGIRSIAAAALLREVQRRNAAQPRLLTSGPVNKALLAMAGDLDARVRLLENGQAIIAGDDLGVTF